MDKTIVSIETAKELLRSFQVDDERSNERSAMVWIALAALKLGDKWADATNKMYGTRAIMDWIRDECHTPYTANTRETIRRFTLHQFDEAGLVEQNADKPERPINSPKWNYRITEPALDVVRSFGTAKFDDCLTSFLAGRQSWKAMQREQRELVKVPVTLPGGKSLKLSAGGQNILIKAMVEQFCSRFAPGGEVLYIDDTSHEEGAINHLKLAELNIVIPERGKAPDLIVWMEDKQWLFLMEACSTHGPIDVTRKNEMRRLFDGHKGSVVYVSCFPTRKIMQKYLSDLAWETEAWCSDTPDHMIHLDGEKFMGPYRSDE